MRRPLVDLGAASASGAGASLPVPDGDLDYSSLFILGTFVGTVSIEVSPDGSNFVTAKDAYGVALIGITAPGVYHLWGKARKVRRNVTAYTSGTINFLVYSGT